MSRHGSYDDWNNLYENEWPVPLTSFSKKWAWHFANQPFVNYVINTTLPIREERKYKRSGPNTYSQMYKRTYTTITYTDYVNDMGDL